MLSIYTWSNVIPFDRNILNKVAANSNKKKLPPTITQEIHFVLTWLNYVFSLPSPNPETVKSSSNFRVISSDSTPTTSKINIDTLDWHFISFVEFDYNSARQIMQRIDKKYLSSITMIEKNNAWRIRVTHELQNWALLTEDLEVFVSGK